MLVQNSSRRAVRVLHVLNELRASGAEIMLRSAAPQWAGHGVECHVLAVAPSAGPLAQDLSVAGYPVMHEPDVPLRRVPARLRMLVSAGRYDVVHLHAERGNFWFGLAALSARAAAVRTVHSIFPFRGALRAERAVQRRTLSALSVVHVAVSAAVAGNEHRRFHNRAQVVPNWYDSSFAPPTAQERARARAELRLSERAFVAVSVGNCAGLKRHNLVLEAMAHPRSPRGLVYLHVGQEDEEHSERHLAEVLEVGDRTRFLGLRHPLQALHAADVFVMPSVREGVGIAAIEALATGLPAVLADSPGLRDLAGNGPAVRLTDDTPEAIACTLAAVMHDAERGECIRRPPDAVCERFSMERGVAAYAGIYQNLLTQRG